MGDLSVLQQIGLLVVTAAAFLLVGQRLSVPTIVSYMLAGLALGPLTGAVSLLHDVDVIAEIGILLLLFLVGLELSFDKVKDLGSTALIAGLVQMGGTFAIAFAVALAFGLATMTAVFVGLGLMFSSTVVVVKQLQQAGTSDTPHGRLAVGVLLAQDLAVIVVLTVLAAVQGSSSPDLHQLLAGLGHAALGMAILLGATGLAGRFLLPRLFAWASTDQQTALLLSLGWCFVLVAGAEAFELSPEIGAFLAGMALAQLPYAHHFRRRINPLTNFFIALFFVTLGIRMELGAAFSYGAFALLSIPLGMLAKIGLLTVLLPRIGSNRETGLMTGVSLMQISEFSLILGALGVSSGLIDSSVNALLGLNALVSITVSSLAYSHKDRLLGWLRGTALLRNSPREGGRDQGPKRQGHLVLIGVNPLSEAIVEELRDSALELVLVERDARKARTLGCSTVLGDVLDHETLEDAGFREAAVVVSTLQIEPTNELIAYRCRQAGVPCVIHAFTGAVVPALERLEVAHLLRTRTASTESLEQELRSSGALER